MIGPLFCWAYNTDFAFILGILLKLYILYILLHIYFDESRRNVMNPRNDSKQSIKYNLPNFQNCEENLI